MRGFHVCIDKKSARMLKNTFGHPYSQIIPITVDAKHFVAAGHNDGEDNKKTAVFTHIHLSLYAFNRAISLARKKASVR
jgi:hypothetical protein